MGNDEKKAWSKPELEILAQGKPEEAVLTACKFLGALVQGPGDANRGNNTIACQNYPPSGSGDCSSTKGTS